MRTKFHSNIPDADQRLMRLTMSLTRVSRSYLAVADKMAANFDLSQAAAWPVIMIGRLGDGVRPGAVADALGLEPSSLVRVIDQVIAAGLVERKEDASDRRAKTLHLTPEGRRHAEQLEKALVSFRRKLFRGVPEDDIDACNRVFEALSQAIANYAESADARESS
jgi:MarR family transcriptional regulator for hemolysin